MVISYLLVVRIKILLQLLVEYLEIKDNFEDVVYILFGIFEVRSAKDYFQDFTLKLYMFFQDFVKAFTRVDLLPKVIPTLLYCNHQIAE